MLIRNFFIVCCMLFAFACLMSYLINNFQEARPEFHHAAFITTLKEPQPVTVFP